MIDFLHQGTADYETHLIFLYSSDLACTWLKMIELNSGTAD